MSPRHVAFIAYETLRAHKRVTDPKSAGPYWYELEDPEVQAAFTRKVIAAQQGARDEAVADLDPAVAKLFLAVIDAL